MPDPATLRDSTEILLPESTFEGIEDELEDRFTLTVHAHGDDRVRLIGSPVEIQAVSGYLARNGIGVQ